jgi:two-component system NarL family sensor kinase
LTDPGAFEEGLRARLRAEQDERRRLAEVVHDGPLQHVAALSQMLDAATAALEQGDAPGAGALLSRARAVAREASADLRDLIAVFEPVTLAEQGFAAAVEELAGRVGTRRGIEVVVDAPAGSLLGERARSGLYQIVREALDQAVRRGPPHDVSVTLTQTATGGVELVITDDGAQERRQAVLDGLAERSDDLNGTFTYERTESTTTIRIGLPPSAAYV